MRITQTRDKTQIHVYRYETALVCKAKCVGSKWLIVGYNYTKAACYEPSMNEDEIDELVDYINKFVGVDDTVTEVCIKGINEQNEHYIICIDYDVGE